MTKLSLVELQLDERRLRDFSSLTEQELDSYIRQHSETAALVNHIERGPEWTTPLVIPLRSSWWSRLVEFAQTYRLYRKQHGRRYSARIAWSIAFLGTPF
jgi:hypothetical protein